MKRKTFTVGLLTATTAIALNACSDPKKQILGKWQVDEVQSETMIFEFLPNGSLMITLNDKPFLSANYEFADGKMTIKAGVGDNSTSTVKFEGDRMIMTQTNGDKQAFKRIK
ncbi:hypothetical protein TUMEXPCC7403_15745 [Tumidithrix helvetica PCC 7403]|uniref:hypothetical protein n=1 Tax=Tumidithrix helvetica TaxID=3457545 RepID=UPI003CA59143